MIKNIFLVFLFLASFRKEFVDPSLKLPKEPEMKRGAHFTSYAVTLKNFPKYINSLFLSKKLNTIVIAIKEVEGKTIIPDIKEVEAINAYSPIVKNLKSYITYLRFCGFYTIARQVVFADNTLPKKRQDLAVKTKDGKLWKTYKGWLWANPYKKEVWEYNLKIAKKAVEIGFQEIQFDYVRFPADGPTEECFYDNPNHSREEAMNAIVGFLRFAKENLKNAKVSVCLFGLTPSVKGEMGIGQNFIRISNEVDYICPMVYPSHYSKGQFGCPDPEKLPFEIVYKSISDAIKKLNGQTQKLRPYLQAFSLKHKYTKNEVYLQTLACQKLNVKEWLFWDPYCRYDEVP